MVHPVPGKPGRTAIRIKSNGLNPYHRLYRLADGWVYVVPGRLRNVKLFASSLVVAAAEVDCYRPHPNETVFASAMASAFEGDTETLDALKAAGVPALGSIR